MATKNRLRSLIIAAVAIVTLAAAAAPAYSAPKVHVRVEDGNGTVVWSTVTPFTGTVQGHPLATPTPLGALITATTNAHVPLGLQWFDPYGFFVNSIDGRGPFFAGFSTVRATKVRSWSEPSGRMRRVILLPRAVATDGGDQLFLLGDGFPVGADDRVTGGEDLGHRQLRVEVGHHRTLVGDVQVSEALQGDAAGGVLGGGHQGHVEAVVLGRGLIADDELGGGTSTVLSSQPSNAWNVAGSLSDTVVNRIWPFVGKLLALATLINGCTGRAEPGLMAT